MDVSVKFGDSMLNGGRIIRLFVGRTFVQYLIAFSIRQEAAIGVISGRFVRPIEPGLNRSGEIQPKAGCGDFECCQPEVAW